MRSDSLVFLIVGVILLFLVLYVKRGQTVTETEKRNLKNLEVEMKLEGFLAQYPRLHSADFEGAYAIHNSSQGKWHFGSSETVYHTVHSIVSGNSGPRSIYIDICEHDFFSVRFVALQSSSYRYQDDLLRALEKTYGERKQRYF